MQTLDYDLQTKSYKLKKEFADKLAEINAKKKALESEEKELKKSIQNEIDKIAPHGANIGTLNFVVSEPYLSLELDEEKLKNEYPFAYHECLVPCFKDRSVRFMATKKGE